MLALSQRISKTSETAPVNEPISIEENVNQDLARLQTLMDSGDSSEAFFLARRLVSQGEEWAEEWVAKAKNAF